MVRRVTYWLCSQSHEHPSPKDADLCDNPYTGNEIVQWEYFEIGERLVQFPEQALSCCQLDKLESPNDMEIWAVTGVETREAPSRPGQQYRFERAVYTIVSSGGGARTVSGIALRNGWTRIKNIHRVLLAYRRRFGERWLVPDKEIAEVVRVVTEKARGFNPPLE